jgi:hypothetical protein
MTFIVYRLVLEIHLLLSKIHHIVTVREWMDRGQNNLQVEQPARFIIIWCLRGHGLQVEQPAGPRIMPLMPA